MEAEERAAAPDKAVLRIGRIIFRREETILPALASNELRTAVTKPLGGFQTIPIQCKAGEQDRCQALPGDAPHRIETEDSIKIASMGPIFGNKRRHIFDCCCVYLPHIRKSEIVEPDYVSRRGFPH